MGKYKNSASAGVKRFFQFEWFRKLSRNSQLAAILLVVLAVTATVAFGATSGDTDTDISRSDEPSEIEIADVTTARVLYFEGTVEFTTDNGLTWQEIQQDSKIEQGSALRTVGALSKAVLGFDDGSELRVDSSSEIKLETLTSGRIIVLQSSGYTYARLVQVKDRSFMVTTENAQFESTGTAFRVITTGDEEAVEVYQNQVRETVTNKQAGQGERISITESDDGLPSSKVENIQLNTIKDNEFLLWNRQRDQDSELFKDQLGFLSDFEGPSITITSPAPSSTVKVSDGENPTVVFEGRADNDAQLTVLSKSVNGSQPQSIDVANGTFISSEVQAATGSSVFEFVGKDRRGNVTIVNVTLTIVREATTQAQGITLVTTQTSSIVKLQWGVEGLTAADGYYVVYDSKKGPVYPDSLSEKTNKKNFTLEKSELTADETYYFRVCRYLGDTDTCDNYSNETSLTLE